VTLQKTILQIMSLNVCLHRVDFVRGNFVQGDFVLDSHSAYLQSGGLDVVRGICTLRELNQIDLDLVPAVGQFERQCTDERTYLRRACHAAGAKPPPDVAVIQHLQSNFV